MRVYVYPTALSMLSKGAVQVTANLGGVPSQLSMPMKAVMAFKGGTMTWDAYATEYDMLLSRAPEDAWRWLATHVAYHRSQEVGLLMPACYCTGKRQCHVRLLAQWMDANQPFPDHRVYNLLRGLPSIAAGMHERGSFKVYVKDTPIFLLKQSLSTKSVYADAARKGLNLYWVMHGYEVPGAYLGQVVVKTQDRWVVVDRDTLGDALRKNAGIPEEEVLSG